jgi:hypothetical protein
LTHYASSKSAEMAALQANSLLNQERFSPFVYTDFDAVGDSSCKRRHRNRVSAKRTLTGRHACPSEARHTYPLLRLTCLLLIFLYTFKLSVRIFFFLGEIID